jgi:thiaminase/transcriptional activator TenA
VISDDLRASCDVLWEELLQHPFVRDAAAGTLPLERFRFYLEQDILFLDDYARAIGIAAGRTEDDETLRLLTEELSLVVEREIASERELLARVGGGSVDPEPAATTVAYGSFGVATAARGDPLDLLAAQLPCAWSYAEIGLRHAPTVADHPVYADWLRFFGEPEYVDAIAERRAAFDRLAAGAAPERLLRLSELFTTATRLEHAFWQLAYGARSPFEPEEDG